MIQSSCSTMLCDGSILVTYMHLFLCLLCNRFDRDWRKIEAFVGSKTVIQVYKYMLCSTLSLCLSLLFTFLSSDKICLVVWLGNQYFIADMHVPGLFG